jgi:hypothetical protein
MSDQYKHIEMLAKMQSMVKPCPQAPWPERVPISDNYFSVPSLQASLLPDPLRPWVEDTAERASIPLPFVAVPALVALGAVVGRSVNIRPERFDDWSVVPNLWGGIIAPPGMLKSHAISEALAPLGPLIAAARLQFQEDKLSAEARQSVLKAQLGCLQRTKQASQNEVASLLRGIRDAAVIERRYQTSDVTVEKLGELLRDNPRGILLVRDELAGVLRTLDKPGREGEREFFLEAWNGNSPFTFDRIARGSVHVPAMCLSIVGGIQPGKLQIYVSEALMYEAGADGLLQRFQLLVCADELGPWERPKRWPDTKAKRRAFDVYAALDVLPSERLGVERDDLAGKDTPPFLRFAPKAQAIFDSWRGDLEARLRSPELGRTPAFCAHLAKYRRLMPSIALLYDLTDRVAGLRPEAGGVAPGPTEKAVAFCEFLEHHARKVYSHELAPGTEAARALARRIEEGSIRDGDSVREIYRAGWAGLSSHCAVRAGLQKLSDFGWVRMEDIATGGRPAEVVRLHPDFRRNDLPQRVCVSDPAKNGTDRTDESPPDPPFVGFGSAPDERSTHTQLPQLVPPRPQLDLEGFFEERAAILEYEANLPRREAERRASLECNTYLGLLSDQHSGG